MNKEYKDYSYEYENSSDEFIAGGKTFRKEDYKDGSFYIGEFRGDKLHGQGTYTFADGTKYIGEFKNDDFNGHGTFVFISGGRYTGEFRDNKFHGHGEYIHPSGDRYIGEWIYDKEHGRGFGTTTVSCKRTTEAGEFVETPEKYVGPFLNGLQHGEGIYHYANGDKYIGIWRHGEVVAGQGNIVSKETQRAAELSKRLNDAMNHQKDQMSASILKSDENCMVD